MRYAFKRAQPGNRETRSRKNHFTPKFRAICYSLDQEDSDPTSDGVVVVEATPSRLFTHTTSQTCTFYQLKKGKTRAQKVQPVMETIVLTNQDILIGNTQNAANNPNAHYSLYKHPLSNHATMLLRQRRQLLQQRAAEETEIFPSTATSPAEVWWWPPSKATNALTENEEQIWNHGGYAPAYIRFEFDVPFRCARIDLLPRMVPKSGTVVHEIRVGASEVYRFSGRASDRDWIHADLNPDGQRIKVVEIHTIESPSWVAWRRVRFWAHVIKE